MVSEDKKWFILNHFEALPAPRRQTAQTCIDRFNSAGGCQLELFAPTFVKAVNINGRQIKREQPLTFHYVFVRGTLDEIKRLCSLSNGFSFVLNRSSEERYATVDDKRMDDFKAIARAYSNSLPFFALDDRPRGRRQSRDCRRLIPGTRRLLYAESQKQQRRHHPVCHPESRHRSLRRQSQIRPRPRILKEVLTCQ